MPSLNDVIKELVKLYPALDGVLNASAGYFSRLESSITELKKNNLENAAQVFSDALALARENISKGTEKLATLLKNLEAADREVSAATRDAEVTKAAKEVASFVTDYASTIKTTVADATRYTDTIVQYVADEDQQAAHLIANGIGAAVYKGTDTLRMVDYDKWIIVGGQNVNPLFVTYVSLKHFKDITSADEGKIFVQYKKTPRRELWAAAGWTKEDTLKTAEYLVANWILRDTVKKPWATEVDFSGLIITSLETGSTQPELAGLKIPTNPSITQEPISWDAQGRPVFPPIGKIDGATMLALMGLVAAAPLVIPLGAGALALSATGAGITLGSRGSANLISGLSARAPAALIAAMRKSPTKVIDTILSWSPKVRDSFLTTLAKTPTGKVAVQQVHREIGRQIATSAGASPIARIGLKKALLGTVGLIAGLTTLSEFTQWKAKEMLGDPAIFSLWTLIDTGRYCEALARIPESKQWVDRAAGFIEQMGWLSPITLSISQGYRDAQYLQIDATEKAAKAGCNIGTVEVISDPAKADVFLDAKLQTYPTNTVIKGIKPGKHTVTVKYKDRKPVPESCTFDLEIQGTHRCEFKFADEKPVWKTLTVSGPKDAEIEINGTYLGRVPFSDELPPGTYSVKVYHPDYTTAEKDIKLGADKNEKYEADYDMDKLPQDEQRSPTKATVGFDVPEGTKIIIDGVPQKYPGSQTVLLDPGEHDIKLVHKDFGELEYKLTVEAGTVYTEKKVPDDFTPPEVVAPAPTKYGVTFRTDPVGAKISINGVFTGEYTPDRILLEKGTYNIAYDKSGYKHYEATVEIG